MTKQNKGVWTGSFWHRTETSNGYILLNDLYSLPNIVRVVKSRRMRWAGHVAHMGDDRRVGGEA